MNYKVKRTFIGQFPHKADLLESLTAFVQKNEIHLGRILGIGATMRAVVAYYDQAARKYLTLEFKEGMEILSLSGNVSLRDEKPFVHAHIVLGDRDGKVIGGHLMPGTKLFACEVSIDEFEGDVLERGFDELTGLYLWKTGNLSR
jgi:predicted DNA-binding protein with PD1-like motif